MKNYKDFARNLESYTKILLIIQDADPEIKFLGAEGYTVGFKKNKKQFNHAISTWQYAFDPMRPAITEEQVDNMVIEAMKNY